MPNQVILVLDREAAEELQTFDLSYWLDSVAGTDDGAGAKLGFAVNEALEVDPETRIEHIARALENETPGRKPDIYNRLAKSAWSALCENPGQERGLVDGVPGRVDRTRALGNALVPQIAQWIGERIMTFEEAQSNSRRGSAYREEG